jgi:hypothetical protein
MYNRVIILAPHHSTDQEYFVCAILFASSKSTAQANQS